MIPKQYRLKHKRDFDILFAEGKFLRARHITAKVWQIDSTIFPKRAYTDDLLRIGFVVSKKVDKRAVRRNSIKRKMREACRLIIKKHPEIGTGYFILFMAGPDAGEMGVAEFQQDIEFLCKKIGILS